MARLTYSGGIDFVNLVEAEVDQRFVDISAKVAAKHDTVQFARRGIRYRHFKYPITIYASSEKTGTALWTGALDKVGNWNWTNGPRSRLRSK